MNAESRQAHSEHSAALQRQRWLALSEFDGPVPAFWEQYLQAIGQDLQARGVLLLSAAVGQPWKALAQWPAQADLWSADPADLLQLLAGVLDEQPRLERLPQGGQMLAMRLPQPATAQVLAVVALHAGEFAIDGLLAWARQAAQVPAQWARHASARASAAAARSAASSAVADTPAAALDQQPHAQRLYQVLRLSIDLSRQPRFLQRAYELCNALAVRFECDRVSLGWMHAPYVRLVAISHVEKFDRLSALSRALEGAMEEAADQGQALVHPVASGSRLVARAHESYALMQGVAAVASVPLLDGEQVLGVLSLEKRQGQWSAEELWELGLMAQVTAQPLAELELRERWWGARLWRRLSGKGSQAGAGPRHSAWKLAGAAGLAALLAVCLLPWEFRVDARLTLRSKDLLFVPAPFDGYLRQVHVDIGDKVQAGQVLMQLDTRELLLEESMTQADVVRYGREAEKAQALRQLAEMQISIARRDQSAARLALIRHQLAHAKVSAPQAGVVVEGELKKNLGAPLRKGDLLLKLAQGDSSYLELEIDQSDVHEVQVGSRGEFALVGRPEQRFAIEIERIDPAAVLREGRNVYLARGRVSEGMAAWWRPGMGGTARIDAGERPLIWVMTYRSVRFLREFFWL